MNQAAAEASQHAFSGGSASATAASLDPQGDIAFRRALAQRRMQVLVGRILLLVATLGLWEMSANFGWVDPTWTSRPTAIVKVLWDWIVTGFLWPNLYATVAVWFWGLLIGVVAGVAAGIFLGLNRFVFDLLDPALVALYSIPRIALAPLFVIWFGIGWEPRVILTAFVVVFLTMRNTYAGVRNIDSRLSDIVLVMGATPRQMLWKVVLPSSLGMIFVGIRMSIPYALVGAVAAEFVASTQGIGYLILAASGVFNTTGVFAGIVVLVALGFVADRIAEFIERRTSRWQANSTST